jgi:hypothetical protein
MLLLMSREIFVDGAEAREFSCGENAPPGQHATGNKKEPVGHHQTAQARHGGDYRPRTSECNLDFECSNLK